MLVDPDPYRRPLTLSCGSGHPPPYPPDPEGTSLGGRNETPTPNVAGGAWYRPEVTAATSPPLPITPVLGNDLKVATRGRLATGANVSGPDPDCGPARAHCRLAIRMPSFVPVPGHLGAGGRSRAQSGASTLELPAGVARPWQQKGDLEILVFRVAAGKGQTPHATPQSRTSGSGLPGGLLCSQVGTVKPKPCKSLGDSSGRVVFIL